MTMISAPVAPARSVSSVLSAPFRAIWGALIAMAEAGPKMQALTRLSETSDAELAAKGRTREGEIRRILGASFYAS